MVNCTTSGTIKLSAAQTCASAWEHVWPPYGFSVPRRRMIKPLVDHYQMLTGHIWLNRSYLLQTCPSFMLQSDSGINWFLYGKLYLHHTGLPRLDWHASGEGTFWEGWGLQKTKQGHKGKHTSKSKEQERNVSWPEENFSVMVEKPLIVDHFRE